MDKILTPKQVVDTRNNLGRSAYYTGHFNPHHRCIDYRTAVSLLDTVEELREQQISLRELVGDLARLLRAFGADQNERQGSMYRRAAKALDRADQVFGVKRV